MKIGIAGAGATGGFLGAMLARAGCDPLLLARGAQLEALRNEGLTLQRAGDLIYSGKPRVTADPAGLAECDILFITVKSHSLLPLLTDLIPVVSPGCLLVFAQNGIPWWYFHGNPGEFEGTVLQSVDPGGRIAALAGDGRVLGCVVWPATSVAAPGVIDWIEGERLTLGAPDGARSEGCRSAAAALSTAGLKSSCSSRLRSEIWLKITGNAVLNPISALTRRTLKQIATDPFLAPAALAAMYEVMSVAAAFQIQVSLSPEQRLEGAGAVGDHRPSMLQDLEAGRALEIDPLLGAVVEMAHLTGCSVPRLELLYALCKGLSV